MNKEKYLNRINLSGELKPTLEVLKILQKAHLLSVPFENLDIHNNRPIELNIEQIFEKIVANNRGGFCYELNGLFYELLTSIGFNAKRISARVFDKEKGYGHEFDHLAIIVNIDGSEYLADVGFGEFTFAPLKLELNTLQNDQRGDFVIRKYDEQYFQVSKMVNGQSTPEYIFTKLERAFADFNEMCLYHQTNPNSHFTQKRLISLPNTKGRITITGNLLKIREEDSTTELKLNDETDFHKKLWNYFKIKIEV